MSAVLERCEKAEKGSDICRLMSYIHGMLSASKYLHERVAELEHKNASQAARIVGMFDDKDEERLPQF